MTRVFAAALMLFASWGCAQTNEPSAPAAPESPPVSANIPEQTQPSADIPAETQPSADSAQSSALAATETIVFEVPGMT